MTDDELAGKLEWNAKHGSHAFPPLLYAAAERIYTLSAHVALLKASLAQAEREAEKATASAEPFGYFRVTPFGWEDCAETGDGAIPLYTAPQPAANAEPAIPAFNCWSSGDGECWHTHPADACILDAVFSDGAPKVGDEYEVLAGWRSVDARYRITSVDEDGDVEVECISHAREAAPQPDRVAEREAESATPNHEETMNQLQLPALADGETYIGAIGDKNGDAYHLVLLPGDSDPAPLADQIEWAKSIGGGLPNKLETAMLFASAKDGFKPKWYWANETFVDPRDPEDDGWAWCQFFISGYQHFIRKCSKLRARSVRRVPVEVTK